MGHLKADHRMNRNHYLGQTGDAINATLSAAGFNLRKLLAFFLRLFVERLIALNRASAGCRLATPAHTMP